MIATLLISTERLSLLMKTRFTQGSVFCQLFTMMLASWVAMLANMLVMAIDMLFLSYLNQPVILASVGFSGSLMLIVSSLGFGFSVATGVLVSQRLSQSGSQAAGRSLSHILLLSVAITVLLVCFFFPLLPWFLDELGAEPDVKSFALSYLTILFPSAPLAVLTLVQSSGLRSIGAAKASMWVALSVALVNVVLDPIFIFVLDFGLDGAAMATVISRLCSVFLGFYWLTKRHPFLRKTSVTQFIGSIRGIGKIAVPAVMTNLFTPIGSLIVVSQVASFGTEAMAGQALVSSLSPLLLSVYFSMTGAAGPMIGQNVGANQPERVAKIYQAGLAIIIGYTFLLWMLLGLTYPWLINLYNAQGLAAELLRVYCLVQVPLFAGLGVLALSNAMFNNLDKPFWSAGFNGVRSTAATFILCLSGGYWFGLYGVVIGASLSFALFGVFTLWAALHLFHKKYPKYHLLSVQTRQ